MKYPFKTFDKSSVTDGLFHYSRSNIIIIRTKVLPKR